jgi:hypothetical protein
MPARRGGWRGMYATSATEPSLGRADTAKGLERLRAMRGLPGRRRDRRLQHARNPSRCQRGTWRAATSTSVLPPQSPRSHAHPEQSIRWAKASIRATKDRRLMAQCKTLNEEVSTHRQGDPKRHDRAKGGTHRP